MFAKATRCPDMTGTPPAVVSASKLGLTFETDDGPVQALSDVDLTIGKGEFVSFIGPSGCGKTTFLRVIADLEQPTAGTISVNGMTPATGARSRAYGYVFQAAALFPWRTIERNVALPLEIMGISGAEQAERIKRTHGPRQPDRVREEISVAAFRRHAAARLDRPGAGLRCRPAADGRAVRRARRDRPRPSQRAVAGTVGADRTRRSASSPIRSPRRSTCRRASW